MCNYTEKHLKINLEVNEVSCSQVITSLLKTLFSVYLPLVTKKKSTIPKYLIFDLFTSLNQLKNLSFLV